MGLPDQLQVPPEDRRRAVESLFSESPTDGDRILYIGNTRPLIATVDQYCEDVQYSKPAGLAVELYDDRLPELRRDSEIGETQILNVDFLTADLGNFDYVLGYPPMVWANELANDRDIDRLRTSFRGAKGNFNLGSLHLEHALESHLVEDGRVTMVLPPDFVSSESARPLRKLITARYHVEELDKLTNSQQVELLLVTVVNRDNGKTQTPAGEFALPKQGGPWSRALEGAEAPVDSNVELQDVCRRISAGVATGADEVFVRDADDPILEQIDEKWVYPVVGGKHLATHDEVKSDIRIICPYTPEGLATEAELGDPLREWLELNREKLENRAAIDSHRGGKPWYAWAQKPNLDDLERAKILTRDFADEVTFWLDHSGEYIPRRTVYSIVPRKHVEVETLYEYLTRSEVSAWIEASSDYKRGYRIRTRTLREVPIPPSFTPDS